MIMRKHGIHLLLLAGGFLLNWIAVVACTVLGDLDGAQPEGAHVVSSSGDRIVNATLYRTFGSLRLAVGRGLIAGRPEEYFQIIVDLYAHDPSIDQTLRLSALPRDFALQAEGKYNCTLRIGQYEARGFPFRSASCFVPELSTFGGLTEGFTFREQQQFARGALVLSITLDERYRVRSIRAIPYRPLWLGMFGNTIVYYVALALPWLGTVAIRRRVRLISGRCVICGYDLRHLTEARCPECGATDGGTSTL
jgi:hypothetical protein